MKKVSLFKRETFFMGSGKLPFVMGFITNIFINKTVLSLLHPQNPATGN